MTGQRRATVNEERVRDLAENANKLLVLLARQAEAYRELLSYCLGELRKSKRFIDMSDDERKHRRDLIAAIDNILTQRRRAKMKIKTSELTGAALDWAVAKCEGRGYVMGETEYAPDGRTYQRGTAQATGPHYSTNWAQGGPIIERERFEFRQANTGMQASYQGGATWFGPTHLIAGMRCYVASELGDEVEVPDGLQ